jgi:hypothetical protein
VANATSHGQPPDVLRQRQDTSDTALESGTTLSRKDMATLSSAQKVLDKSFLTVTVTVACVLPMTVLPMTIVVAVQVGHLEGVRPNTAHHFIDILTKIGDVENPTSAFQVGIY